MNNLAAPLVYMYKPSRLAMLLLNLAYLLKFVPRRRLLYSLLRKHKWSSVSKCAKAELFGNRDLSSTRHFHTSWLSLQYIGEGRPRNFSRTIAITEF